MAVTPTGVLSLALDAMADLVAASATFQTWVGAANEAAAKPRVYRVARSGSGASAFVRPFALVSFPPGFVVGRGGFAHGQLRLFFEDDVAPADAGDHTDAAYRFTNQVGGVLADIMDTSEASGRLLVQENGITVEIEPQRSGPSEEEDYFQASFLVDYGLR